MRYRKRISLGKGAHINLSKSGVSFSAGVKGLSTSVGKKGVYLNTSIPGTGLYSRTKIAGGSSSKSRSSSKSKNYASSSSSAQGTAQYRIQVEIDIDDNGVAQIRDLSGNVITDAALLKAIKASPEYKTEIARLSEVRMQEYEERMHRILNIQEFTPVVYSTDDWVKRIQSMQPQEYVIESFDEPVPSMQEVERDLADEADRAIDTKNPFKRSKLKERYISDTKVLEFNSRCEEWQKRKDAFDLHQRALKKKFDLEEAKKHEERLEQCMKLVDGDRDMVDLAVESWLKGVQFDFEFDLEYDYSDGVFFVDIDLPEVEELPITKAQKMASGVAKVKPKSAKEIREDYSKCVYGLAIFFAGNLFNKALNTQELVVSGYTQKRNKSGDIVDDYIFSILFDRETFMKLDYYNNDPKANCMKFKNRVIQNADSSFKTIKPYSVDDFKEE